MKRTVAFYWLIGIAVAVLAIALGFYFDDTVRDFMAEHQTPALRSFMRYVSLFGDWPLHTALGLLLLVIAWIRDSKKWTRIFLAMLIAMSLAGVTGNVIKRTIPRPRPSVHTDMRWGGPRFSSKYHAFPSGHTAASTAFFSVLFFASRRIGLVFLPIPIVIGFSRIYVAAHYLSDVVFATILGALCAAIVCRLFLQKISNPQSAIRN